MVQMDFRYKLHIIIMTYFFFRIRRIAFLVTYIIHLFWYLYFCSLGTMFFLLSNFNTYYFIVLSIILILFVETGFYSSSKITTSFPVSWFSEPNMAHIISNIFCYHFVYNISIKSFKILLQSLVFIIWFLAICRLHNYSRLPSQIIPSSFPNILLLMINLV